MDIEEKQEIGFVIVRDWLNKYREMLRQLEDEEERLIRLTNHTENVSSPQLTDMPRNPSPDRDKITGAIARKDLFIQQIWDKHDFLKTTRNIVEKLLSCCNAREAAAIRLYYLSGMEWPEIVPYMFNEEERADNSRCLQNLYRYRRGAVSKITAVLEASDGKEYPTLLDVSLNNLQKKCVKNKENA